MVSLSTVWYQAGSTLHGWPRWIRRRRSGQGIDAAEVRRRSVATIPAGRYGRPDEFAAVVGFLASESAGYVTASLLSCDGGMMRSLT